MGFLGVVLVGKGIFLYGVRGREWGFFLGGDIKKGVKPMLVLIRMCVLRV